MIIGTEKILQWFTMNDKPFWIIRRSEKSDMITRSPDDDPALDSVKSKEILQSALSLLSPEVYYIQTWGGSDPKATTGAKTCVHFRLLDGENRNTGVQSVISGVDPQTFEAKVRAEVEKEMTAYKEKQELLTRIGALETQLKEDSGGDFWQGSEKTLGILKDWGVPEFIRGLNPQANVGKMQPVNKENVKEMTEEQVSKIEAALAVLQTKVGEENLPALMEKLAALSQNDPKTFNMALKILK